jgi:hypothetical protein
MIVLEICIQQAHTKPGERFTVGKIADEASLLASVRGDKSKHSYREVGAILSGFGVPRIRRKQGMSITMNKLLADRLHELARQHGVLNFAPAGECETCDEIKSSSRSGGIDQP